MNPTPENPVAPTPKRHAAWRMGNTAFILLVFFAPWANACSVLNGYHVTYFTWIGVLGHNFRADNPADTWKLETLYLMVAVGLTAFLIYTAASLFSAWGPPRFTTTLFWRGLTWLLLSVSALGLATGLALVKISLLWGYWLAWLGLASAAGAELQTLRRPTQPPS